MCERLDNKCYRCNDAIIYEGNSIDAFEDTLICEKCWIVNDYIKLISHTFSYNIQPIINKNILTEK